MFAHCLLLALLPALLQQAAVDALSTYTTVIDRGDFNIPLGPTKPYYIPALQCTAAITQIKEQEALQCSPGKVARVQVTVVDYAPGTMGYISDDLDSATITRGAPCAGDAQVQVRVGCRFSLRSRSDLSPQPLPRL